MCMIDKNELLARLRQVRLQDDISPNRTVEQIIESMDTYSKSGDRIKNCTQKINGNENDFLDAWLKGFCKVDNKPAKDEWIITQKNLVPFGTILLRCPVCNGDVACCVTDIPIVCGRCGTMLKNPMERGESE